MLLCTPLRDGHPGLVTRGLKARQLVDEVYAVGHHHPSTVNWAITDFQTQRSSVNGSGFQRDRL